MGKNAALGIGLALIGTLASAMGYTLQKIAHRRADKAAKAKAKEQKLESPEVQPSDTVTITDGVTQAPVNNVQAASKPTSYWSFWQFPAGLLMLVVGAIFTVVTFGMAGQAELAPMAATTMMWNMVLAWKILKEPFGRVDATALFLMSAGTTLALIFSEKNSASYNLNSVILLLNRPTVWIYIGLSTAIMGSLIVVVQHLGKTPAAQLDVQYAALDAFGRSIIAGLLGGFTGFLVKAVVEIVFDSILQGEWDVFQRVEPYMFVIALPICLVNQVRFMNSGLARYESSRIIPVYQSTLVFSSAASGYIMWDEVAVQTTKSLTLFGIGCTLTMCGMLALMWKPRAEVENGEVSAGSGKPEALPTEMETKVGENDAGLTSRSLPSTKEDTTSVRHIVQPPTVSIDEELEPHYARYRPSHIRSASVIRTDGLPSRPLEVEGRSSPLESARSWVSKQATGMAHGVRTWASRNTSYNPIMDNLPNSEDSSPVVQESMAEEEKETRLQTV